MFGRTKNDVSAAAQPTVQVMSIPEEFYGGKNPVVKFKNIEKEVAPAAVVAKKVTPPPVAPPLPPAQTENVLTNRRTWVIGGVALFFLFIGGASGYYWYFSKPKSPSKPAAVVTPPNKISQPAVVTTSVPVGVTPTSTTAVVPVTSTVPTVRDAKLEFPSLLLGNGQDVDRDGLTDAEEIAFSTDPELPDTDDDGYADATEVNNLYSPTVKAPTRMIDTESVKDYVNPTFKYKLYYPVSWVIGSVDEENRDVLFSTATGDSIEMRVFDKEATVSFEDWFAQWGTGEHLSSLLDFYSMFKVPGLERSDRLVYYFSDEKHMYVLLYRPVPGSNQVQYRNIISMMARSFRLASTVNVLPVQEVVVPAVQSSTSKNPAL